MSLDRHRRRSTGGDDTGRNGGDGDRAGSDGGGSGAVSAECVLAPGGRDGSSPALYEAGDECFEHGPLGPPPIEPHSVAAGVAVVWFGRPGVDAQVGDCPAGTAEGGGEVGGRDLGDHRCVAAHANLQHSNVQAASDAIVKPIN